jgi:predicted RNA binding protein YcfA (HicA-like mRNA interferase family)
MSPRLPTVNARQVLRALERAEFSIVRTAGSHHMLVHRKDPARRVTVPFHGSRDLPPGLVRAIIRQAGLSVEDFVALL